jgi:Uma2 family endonuclease
VPGRPGRGCRHQAASPGRVSEAPRGPVSRRGAAASPSSDLPVYLKIRVGDDFLYPDVFVRCGQERGDPYFKTDPVLVIEVLSPNTQRYDRGDKRLAYQSLPSLQEYVLVTQDASRIEVLARSTQGGWETRLYESLEASVTLSSIRLGLPVNEIYA